MSSELLIRPLHIDDLAAAEKLSSDSFLELDRRTFQRGWPEPSVRGPARVRDWIRRSTHLIEGDAGGCWAAEIEGAMVGFATSFRRDLTWFLATYAVRPESQGVGIGKPLLEAALTHSHGCLRGMLSGSADPKAVRRYRQAGFTAHPQMFMRGTIDRDVLPIVEHVRDGTAGDFDLMNSIDRRVRDAAHGRDHELLSSMHRLIVLDQNSGSGYAYVTPSGEPALLAATNRRTATRLLWEALAASEPDVEVTIPHLTPANEWALDVGFAARLSVYTNGYLALRGMKPPTPYIHSGALL
ncbi:MAG: Ribosomal protein acetylase RimI [Marmoricola sp.]|nr:Ribosomal protein acetylase RimI [Marmoricola sp.]